MNDRPARDKRDRYINDYMDWFIKRYRPKDDGRDWNNRFDSDVHQLVRLVYEEAQRPFIHELNAYRDNTLSALALSTVAPIVKVAEKPK